MSERQYPTIEEKISAVNDWINVLSETGRVSSDVSSEVVKEVLEYFGADLEPRPELVSLSKYGNKFKRPGLDAVWGKERVDQIKDWMIDQYVPDYEQRKQIEMYTLEDTTIKHSGMLQFFGELTAYAANQITFEDYQRLTENRIKKGSEWEQRDQTQPYKRTNNALFPPEFPIVFWDYLKSSRSIQS